MNADIRMGVLVWLLLFPKVQVLGSQFRFCFELICLLFSGNVRNDTLSEQRHW